MIYHTSRSNMSANRLSYPCSWYDTAFFAWFVRVAVEPHAPLFLHLATDWGLDDVWCRAAGEFAAGNNPNPNPNPNRAAGKFAAGRAARAEAGSSSSSSSGAQQSAPHANPNPNPNPDPNLIPTSGVRPISPHACGVIVGVSVSHARNLTGSGISPKHSKAPMRLWRFNFGGFLANKVGGVGLRVVI